MPEGEASAPCDAACDDEFNGPVGADAAVEGRETSAGWSSWADPRLGK